MMQTETEPTCTPSEDKQKRKKQAKARQPGRPHRRLDLQVLLSRKHILKKKLSLLQAKVTICEERLSSYDEEEGLRNAADEK
jgi:hypothetical protein